MLKIKLSNVNSSVNIFKILIALVFLLTEKNQNTTLVQAQLFYADVQYVNTNKNSRIYYVASELYNFKYFITN